MRSLMVVLTVAVIPPVLSQEEDGTTLKIELEKKQLASPIPSLRSSPIAAQFCPKPNNLKLPSEGNWRFLTLKVGDINYLVAMEVSGFSRTSKPKRVFIDKNRNNDITDDEPIEAEGKGRGQIFRTSVIGLFKVDGQNFKPEIEIGISSFGLVYVYSVWMGNANLGGETLKLRWIPPNKMILLPNIGQTMNAIRGWFSTSNISFFIGDKKVSSSVTLKDGKPVGLLKLVKITDEVKKIEVPNNLKLMFAPIWPKTYLLIPSNGKVCVPAKVRYIRYLVAFKKGEDDFAILGYLKDLPDEERKFGDIEPLRLTVHVRKIRDRYYITPSLCDASGRKVYILRNGHLIQPSPILEIKDGDKVVYTYKYSYG